MDKNTYLIIDFDSTFICSETLEELADFVLKNNKNRTTILNHIREITNLGMDGKITFTESLKKRTSLIKATKNDVDEIARLLKKKITPSFEKHRSFFQKYHEQIYIVTGAFKECVLPVVKSFGVSESHILANTLTYDWQGFVTGVNLQNPLAQHNGKYLATKSLGLNGHICVIGDGFTDYQIKEQGAAQHFIAFTENVIRKTVTNQADFVACNFDSVLEWISQQS